MNPKIIVDKSRCVQLLNSVERDPLGITNFCSWERLIEELRASGNVKRNEDVVAFVVTDRGLDIRLKYKE